MVTQIQEQVWSAESKKLFKRLQDMWVEKYLPMCLMGKWKKKMKDHQEVLKDEELEELLQLLQRRRTTNRKKKLKQNQTLLKSAEAFQIA
jgi:hypothetical protein